MLLRPDAMMEPKGTAMKRSVIGTVAALASMAVLTCAMLPLRSHLSIATTALILVVPVVIGVVIGGFSRRRAQRHRRIPGLRLLLHPALPDAVGRSPAELGGTRRVRRRDAPSRPGSGRDERGPSQGTPAGQEIRELFELSDLLVEDKPLDVLLSVIVTTLAEVFGSRQVALFLPNAGQLEIAASAGEPLTPSNCAACCPPPGTGEHSKPSHTSVVTFSSSP